jgi:hypothetical protein
VSESKVKGKQKGVLPLSSGALLNHSSPRARSLRQRFHQTHARTANLKQERAAKASRARCANAAARISIININRPANFRDTAVAIAAICDEG